MAKNGKFLIHKNKSAVLFPEQKSNIIIYKAKIAFHCPIKLPEQVKDQIVSHLV